MHLTLLIAAALTQRQTCADCTENLFCLVTRPTDAECVGQQESDGMGGCGAAGFYQVDGQEVAFSSERCIFAVEDTESSTAPPEPRVPSESPSGGVIAGIVVGAVATVAIAIYITLKFGRKAAGGSVTRSKGRQYATIPEERQQFL